MHTSGGRDPLVPRPIETAEGRRPHRLRTSSSRIAADSSGSLPDTRPGETGYLSRPFPKFARKYSDYDHLARVKEWSLANADGEEGEP